MKILIYSLSIINFGFACLLSFSFYKIVQENDGEMGATFFILLLILLTIFYLPIWVWNFKIFKLKNDDLEKKLIEIIVCLLLSISPFLLIYLFL
jgi:hypothetical protein